MRLKLSNLLTFLILIIIGSIFVIATIGSITLDSPADGATDADGAVTFTCSGTPGSTEQIGTINLITNFTDNAMTVNATNSTVNNSATEGANSTSFIVTGIPDGQYVWNCEMNTTNSSTLFRASGNSTITIDSTAAGSVGPLTFDGTKNNAPVEDATKFDYGTDVTINGCTGSDASTASGSNATLEIRLPDIPTFRFLQNVSGSNNTNEEFVFTDTNDVGDYIANCTFTDAGGNQNSTSKIFTIFPVSLRAGKGGAAAIPGFKFPKGKTIVGTDTTNDAGTLTGESSWLFREGGSVSMTVGGESHTFQVTKIGLGEVTLRVSSRDPFEVTVKEEGTKKVDVTGDGDADVAITLNQITEKGYADITFTLAEGTPDEGPEGAVGADEVSPPSPTGAAGQGMWLVVAIIVIVLVVGYFMIRKR